MTYKIVAYGKNARHVLYENITDLKTAQELAMAADYICGNVLIEFKLIKKGGSN